MQSTFVPRGVERLVAGMATSDGAGVSLTRLLTQDLQHRLDPFLMLDAFGSDDPDDYIAGFPDHPHRGFETVTYMIAGRMLHRDSAGNKGLLENGDVQWMTAAKGVIHSEIPQQEDGVMEGSQLWLNLPAKDKMAAPWYRDFKHEALPRYTDTGGAEVIVIAGESKGTQGAVSRDATQVRYLDVHLPAGTSFEQDLPPEHNAFVVLYRGSAMVGDKPVPRGQMAILATSPGRSGVRITAAPSASEPTRALIIAGRPLKEPIVQYGPFVMNTKEEIYQALADFRDGRLGE
ncbi:pirin family protein [Hydrogenophaga sp. 5NK40-0174]